MADTNQIVIYGASDDLIEIDGAISEEYDIFDSSSTRGTVVLESPDGESMEVTLKFGSGWEIILPTTDDSSSKTSPWPFTSGVSPYNDEDPAVFIDAPAGTTVRLKWKG